MKNIDFNINLNHLSTWEIIRYPETYEEYRKAVVAMLSLKDEVVFEEEIKEEYQDDFLVKSFVKQGKPLLEAIFETTPEKFVSAGRRPKKTGDKKLFQAWFDIGRSGRIIMRDDFLYDLFFVYNIRHVDILKIDSLLDFFLEGDYDSNIREFTRFLKLALRKHGKKLMQADQVETVNEWISEKEKEQSLSGMEAAKTKGKVKRERDDSVTKLNQEQTALLIHFLQAGKIILKDENLNNKDAGHAFSILTGYSADSLRQNLSKTELQRISTPKNISIIANAFTNLQLLINKEIKDKK
ncbi:MAG: hypothetical protein H0W61_12895 [Bacteroidetes bacterium]|nr:hypothetical protein [Bacteroidota bacterium]